MPSIKRRINFVGSVCLFGVLFSLKSCLLDHRGRQNVFFDSATQMPVQSRWQSRARSWMKSELDKCLARRFRERFVRRNVVANGLRRPLTLTFSPPRHRSLMAYSDWPTHCVRRAGALNCAQCLARTSPFSSWSLPKLKNWKIEQFA